MAEYIEREKIVFGVLGLTIVDPAVAAYADAVLHQVQSVPVADVVPVRHAKWEIVVGSNGKEKMVCTECRKQQDLTGVFSYCPNCGAIMDGERKGEANES